MSLHPFPDLAAPAAKLQVFVEDLSATGVVRNAIAIANHAAACGFEVRLLVCRAGGTLADQLGPRVTLVEVDGRPGRRSRAARLRGALRAYRRHIRDWRPDVMLSAGNHGHLLSCLAWAGLPGTKLLRISNDPGHGAARTMPLARLWRALKFRLFVALSDRLILVSRNFSGDTRLARLIGAGQATVIPNGVDVRMIRRMAGAPCPHPWPGDPAVPTVLAVGRHSRQKNFATLLRAFAAASDVRPLRLLVLGDGDQAGARRLARNLGIIDRVAFIPAAANPFPYMARASVLALPSLWEGSSNVLLEAMACGTPVIASRTAGDAVDVLGHGQFGLLVDPLDVEGLAAAILRQVGERPLLPADRALQFERERSLEQYVGLFRATVAWQPRRRAVETQGDGRHAPVATTG